MHITNDYKEGLLGQVNNASAIEAMERTEGWQIFRKKLDEIYMSALESLKVEKEYEKILNYQAKTWVVDEIKNYIHSVKREKKAAEEQLNMI